MQRSRTAAMTPGRFGLAGFAISLVEHDQPATIEAFEAALALSPSCSIALIRGCVSRNRPSTRADALFG
jgi:hypothetical protein